MRRLTQALKHGRLLALIVLAVALAVRYFDPPTVELMRMRGFDVLQELFPRAEGEHPVAIVDVDDESLAALGQWPWPRTLVAGLTDRLTQLGAAVIGFDIYFPEPDRMSPARNLIEVRWFRDLATINPVSYLIEALRSLVIVGWDAEALLLGFGFAFGLIALSMTLAVRQLSVRMTRT